MNYDRLVRTPEQLRYDKMCQSFVTLTDLTVDDKVRSNTIMERIKVQHKQIMT